MKADIPDHDLREPVPSRLSEEREHWRLDADRRLVEHQIREAGQRLSHRFWAFNLSIVIVVFMVVLLALVVHSLIIEGNSELMPSVQLVAYVAPITSTTVITIALLFGAFRGYRDRDENTAASGLSEILRGGAGAG